MTNAGRVVDVHVITSRVYLGVTRECRVQYVAEYARHTD